jgi:hypothetical protein
MATYRRTALIILVAIVAISLAFAVVHEKALVKDDISLKKKCPPRKTPITVDPYRIPLPVMDASAGKKVQMDV